MAVGVGLGERRWASSPSAQLKRPSTPRPVLGSHRRSPATIGWRWVAIAFSFIAFALFTVAVPIAASASAASVVPHRAVDPVLTVLKAGAPAGGTVTSAPAGIACGATCSHNFGIGTLLILHAQPDGASKFTGWSGGCTVVDPITGDCEVRLIISPVTVTATFALLPPPTHLLTVAKAGAPADGTVTRRARGHRLRRYVLSRLHRRD